VIITTGRPLKSALAQARRLGLDQPGCYTIAYNGAMVYDWGKQGNVFTRALDIPSVIRVFEKANEIGEHIQTYDSFDVLVEPRGDDEALRRYCKMVSMTHRVIGDVHTDLQEDPVKCLVINYEKKDGLLKMQDWIRANMEGMDCFFSCEQFLEVVPKGMNKGEAVKMLCKLLGVEIEDAVACGDAANDLAMLKAAGIGVAMINGSDEVKAVADYITTRDNNHDGVAEAADKFFYEAAEI
jgi:Cof subfamily protein (haloacid dehalogenase superfamily)